MWNVYAVLAAVFAAATGILAKIGLKDINSDLGTAIRTMVVLVMAWTIVLVTGKQKGIAELTAANWIFLGLSGLATGLSWIFFYRALQMGEASKVIPIDKLSVVIALIFAVAFLHEKFDWKTIVGGLLLTAGVVLLALPVGLKK